MTRSRYSIMVTEYGSDHAVELMRVGSNPQEDTEDQALTLRCPRASGEGDPKIYVHLDCGSRGQLNQRGEKREAFGLALFLLSYSDELKP